MTPEEFKAARAMLGLSQREMAVDLGLGDGRTIRRWEAGERSIPGSVEITVAYWLRDLERGFERIAFLPQSI